MLISIDVGIKNLSYCLFEIKDENYIIKQWNVINLLEKSKTPNCQHTNNKNKKCTKNASFTLNNNLFYCGTHVKSKDICHACVPDEYYKMLNKKNSTQLIKSLIKDLPILLPDNNINDYIKENYFIKIQKPKSASLVNLIEISKAIKTKLPSLLPLDNITDVLIENQIGPLANRMKSIQGMLTQFFIDNNINNITFVSSQNKLKPFNIGKKTYNERKIIGIVKTREIISTKCIEWINFFENNKKKDDLADAFLQGLWFIKYN